MGIGWGLVWLGWLSGGLGCSYVADRVEGNLQGDLEKMCKVATKIDADHSIDDSKKLDRLVKRVAQDNLGPAGMALIQAVQQAPPAARRKVVEEILAKYGVQDLDCPPLDAILTK